VSSDHPDQATTAHLIRWEVLETQHGAVFSDTHRELHDSYVTGDVVVVVV
jgi:hypothetical protein